MLMKEEALTRGPCCSMKKTGEGKRKRLLFGLAADPRQ
jgi:hypothetical protein